MESRCISFVAFWQDRNEARRVENTTVEDANTYQKSRAAIATQHWDPAQTVTCGKKADTSNNQLFNVTLHSYTGVPAIKVQTLSFLAWSATCFPPERSTAVADVHSAHGIRLHKLQGVMAKYEACEKRAMQAMGPIFYNQLSVKQQKALEQYTDMLRTNVTRLGDDAPLFLRASMRNSAVSSMQGAWILTYQAKATSALLRTCSGTRAPSPRKRR